MTAALNEKLSSKYDQAQAQDAMGWIADSLQEAGLVDEDEAKSLREKASADEVAEALKDGSILCKLMNAVKPDSVKKINMSKMAFKQMDNIRQFLAAAELYGVKKTDLFRTPDLYEGKGITQVVNGIIALGRKVESKGGTGLGPSSEIDDKLKSGQKIIGKRRPHTAIIDRAEVQSIPMSSLGFNSKSSDVSTGLAMVGMVVGMLVAFGLTRGVCSRRRRHHIADDSIGATME